MYCTYLTVALIAAQFLKHTLYYFTHCTAVLYCAVRSVAAYFTLIIIHIDLSKIRRDHYSAQTNVKTNGYFIIFLYILLYSAPWISWRLYIYIYIYNNNTCSECVRALVFESCENQLECDVKVTVRACRRCVQSRSRKTELMFK